MIEWFAVEVSFLPIAILFICIQAAEGQCTSAIPPTAPAQAHRRMIHGDSVLDNYYRNGDFDIFDTLYDRIYIINDY